MVAIVEFDRALVGVSLLADASPPKPLEGKLTETGTDASLGLDLRGFADMKARSGSIEVTFEIKGLPIEARTRHISRSTRVLPGPALPTSRSTGVSSPAAGWIPPATYGVWSRKAETEVVR